MKQLMVNIAIAFQITDLVKRGLIYAKNLDIKIHHTH